MNSQQKFLKRRRNGQFAPGKHRAPTRSPSRIVSQNKDDKIMSRSNARTEDQLSGDRARAIFRLSNDLMEHYGIDESYIDSFEVSDNFPYNANSVVINGKKFRILEEAAPGSVLGDNTWQALIRRKLVLIRGRGPFVKPLSREYVQGKITPIEGKERMA